jgi:hypothetical protein
MKVHLFCFQRGLLLCLQRGGLGGGGLLLLPPQRLGDLLERRAENVRGRNVCECVG